MGQRFGEVPREVPAAPARYVNREADLSLAGGWVVAGAGRAGTIGVVSGPPGVGKSAMVRQLVERVGDSFPGGHLYVDYALFQTGSGAAAVDEAAAQCLRSLGVADGMIPATLAERAKLLRTRTAGRPVLVVLDDVTEPAQVSPLVPNSVGSVVLVTSNERLTELALDDAEFLSLDPLDEEAGVRLLAEVCGNERVAAEPEAVARIVGLCEGLPIALRVAGARLKERPKLAAAELADEIADERRGLAAFAMRGKHMVSPVFTVAYRRLPHDAARLYRLLGHAPGVDVTVELVAEAIDGPVGAAEELIERLGSANLLIEEQPGRFRMLGLIRRDAEQRARADESEADLADAVRRMVRFYLRRAAFADRAVMGQGRLRLTDHTEVLSGYHDPFDGPGGKARALAWLDAERANLIASVRVAWKHHWDQEVWQLAEAATALYVNRRYLADWIESSELGAKAARRCERPGADARLTSFLSRAYLGKGDVERARTVLDYALPLAERVRNPRLVASIWELYGRLHDHEGNYGAAIDAYRQALAMFDRAHDVRGVAFVTYFLGCSLDAAGQSEDALVWLRQALEAIERLGEDRMIGRVHIAVGRAQARLGQSTEAVASLRTAISILSAGGYHHYEAEASLALADLVPPDERVQAVRRALDIHTAAGSPQVEQLRDRLARLTGRPAT
ncbi:tetratricopeptide repeat protein [Kibdelosporangium persicum]|uniref:ATP/maltotriose-dependent transcriptional regulator MalT n=1 Tax=Kibdelosporangium persicum TaxID=2698649 RepID=A0ABX2FDT8_9PSEU|nr:tetratricopeptide repeat protein [Kibdelosporangium persicum]NRN69442.1 ATP/maltotriose-dependent transcriptional regulator MalT [Kibdelosporangium persicum]